MFLLSFFSDDTTVDQEIFQDMESDDEGDGDDGNSEEEAVVERTKKPQMKVTRRRWDDVETEEIHKYFQTFLDSKIVPRTRDVTLAQKKSAKNGGKLWQRSVDKVIKKISAMNHK